MKIVSANLSPRAERGMSILHLLVEADRTELAELVSEVNKGGYEADIRKTPQDRSLNANSLYWKCVDKLRAVLGTTKEETHSELMKSYGALAVDEYGEIETYRVPAGFEPTVDYPVFLSADGEYNVFGRAKPSSDMTSEEFAKLLDGAMYECREAGVRI